MGQGRGLYFWKDGNRGAQTAPHLPAFHSVSQPCFPLASLNLVSVRVLTNFMAPCLFSELNHLCQVLVATTIPLGIPVKLLADNPWGSGAPSVFSDKGHLRFPLLTTPRASLDLGLAMSATPSLKLCKPGCPRPSSGSPLASLSPCLALLPPRALCSWSSQVSALTFAIPLLFSGVPCKRVFCPIRGGHH